MADAAAAVDEQPRAGAIRAGAGSIRAALWLLTRLRVGGAVPDDPGAAAFAVVGGVVGSLGAVPLVIGSLAGEPVLGAVAAVGVVAAVSGGLHLDGLADTADALVAPNSVSAERARQDPAVGPVGAAAILLVLAGQVAALVSVASSLGPVGAGWLLVVAAAASRWLPVAAVAALRASVEPNGLGGWFSAHVSTRHVVAGAATVAVLVAAATVAAAWPVLAAGIGGIAVGYAATVALARARGQLDGDGLGACVELTVLATLVIAALISR